MLNGGLPSGTLETSTAASGNHSPISLPKRTKSIVALGSKVCQHHLELEPLCCLSSCLIRGGCLSVIVFEYIYVIFTFITIILRLHSIGLSHGVMVSMVAFKQSTGFDSPDASEDEIHSALRPFL
ncbi:hypothetical protein DINM_001601 [Dirofilaria immitis]|nr:hypothetical protein [Dirofilaria immitis]